MSPIPLCQSLRPFACIIGAHGVTDMWTHRSCIPLYVFAIPPWPCTSTLLTLLSVLHFADDVGFIKSLLLHATTVWVALIHVNAAVWMITTYMCAVHLPCHIARVCRTSRGKRAVWVMTAVALLSTCWSTYLVCIPDFAQRIACLHILLHLFC